MLRSLHIENLAVIKTLDIDFVSGFTSLTGETGAGKSIIIESINLLLGKKADKELVRTGESFALVSGIFSDVSRAILDKLSENSITPDDDGNIMIQRTVGLDGRSSVKLNGRAVTISYLKELVSGLVSIHGQSDTADLTDAKKQLDIIDMHASNTELLNSYADVYKRLSEVKARIEEIEAKERERERLIEILKYQIEDIDSYGLKDGEEEDLVERKVRIKNSEKITKNAGFVFKALKGSEKGSVSFLLDKSIASLSQISDVIPDFLQYAEKLRDFLYQIDDIAENVYSATEDMDDDPEGALNEIESRLDKISKLKRKYGYTVRDILDFRDKAEAELLELSDSDNLIRKLKKEEEELYNEALLLATQLNEKRRAAAKVLESEVKASLEFLDMPKVVFFTSIENERVGERFNLYPDGMDKVEFYISANRGVDAQPLSKVASGGELARVMLAIKGSTADKDGVDTVIFDEIDAGVSGKTARKIGVKMRSLSKKLQLFAVTHSAQIASLSDDHLLISKSDVNGSTQTSVRRLDYEGRVKELSRILGGIAITDAQRKAAIDMLKSDIDI